MGKGKSRKNKGAGKTCFIPNGTELAWASYIDQQENHAQMTKIDHKQRQKKGHNKK